MGGLLNTSRAFSVPDNERRHAQNFIDAAKAAGTVTTMVASTGFKTNMHAEWAAKDPNYPMAPLAGSKAAVEAVVRAAGFEHHTFLRPPFLMHNYLAPACDRHFPEYRSEHTMAVAYYPSTTMAQLDAADVGKFAAAALLDPPRFHQHEIDLAYANLTLDEVAEQISAVSGIEIRTVYRDADEAAVLGKSSMARSLQMWMREIPFDVDLKKLERYGIPLTPLSAFLTREKEALMETLQGKA